MGGNSNQKVQLDEQKNSKNNQSLCPSRMRKQRKHAVQSEEEPDSPEDSFRSKGLHQQRSGWSDGELWSSRKQGEDHHLMSESVNE